MLRRGRQNVAHLKARETELDQTEDVQSTWWASGGVGSVLCLARACSVGQVYSLNLICRETPQDNERNREDSQPSLTLPSEQWPP